MRDAEVVAQTAVKDLERERTRAEADVEQVRARKDRNQQRLDAGQVNSPKELESLQSEIVSLERRQRALEDTEIEIMEQLETAEHEASALIRQRDEIGAKAQHVQAARDAAWAEIDADATAAQKDRDAYAVELPADFLALYDKIRAAQDGVGAAPIRQRRCEGCRLQLDPVEVSRIRSAAPDLVIRHEECRRILVRTAESGL